jgi:hypothetical protein
MYKAIVIIGTDMSGGQSASENPVIAKQRQDFESKGVKFIIADGTEIFGVTNELQKLIDNKEFGETTGIYISAHGQVDGRGRHYLALHDVAGGARDEPSTRQLSLELLDFLSENVRAYEGFFFKTEVAWRGPIAFDACYSEYVLDQLDRSNVKITNAIATNADRDKPSLANSASTGIEYLNDFLANLENLYSYVLKSFSKTVNPWIVKEEGRKFKIKLPVELEKFNKDWAQVAAKSFLKEIAIDLTRNDLTKEERASKTRWPAARATTASLWTTWATWSRS